MYQKREANKDANKKKKADVVDTINNCDLGNTIWKKKQRKGAKPIAAEPHTKAFVSRVDPNMIAMSCRLSSYQERVYDDYYNALASLKARTIQEFVE